MESIMDYLKREGAAFDEEMARAIPKERKPWEVYGIIWEHLSLGGKRLRPVMCKLSCEAVGGKGKSVLGIGAAIELFHNFSLLHDDIEDCSEVRRGEPCMYKKYGIPLAINAGDGLFMNVWQEILDSGLPPERIVEVQRVLNNAFMRVLEGQAVELNWYRESRLDISEDEYMGMIAGKTGALISASCGVGALIGGASAEQGKALSDFGMAVGLAFQIQDDVLNLVGKEEKYGKEIGGDISEGKRSLITIRALSRASGRQRERLSEILLARTKDQKEIAEAIAICRETGAIDYAAGKAKDMVGKAKEGIMVLPNNEASRRLLQLADFFIYREV
ncbi:MAG: polyprenyl synthetase family protein [Candidatus ainarchaeum sp.]|nr:polyprenyl synthetase family protein [Candidatus ainarchaeum sp.]